MLFNKSQSSTIDVYLVGNPGRAVMPDVHKEH